MPAWSRSEPCHANDQIAQQRDIQKFVGHVGREGEHVGCVVFLAPGVIKLTAETLRIGYQKYGTLVLLKAKGTLEKRLAAQGVQVQWTTRSSCT